MDAQNATPQFPAAPGPASPPLPPYVPAQQPPPYPYGAQPAPGYLPPPVRYAPPPTPSQLYRRDLTSRMQSKKGLYTALFLFAFAYFLSEAVISYATRGIGVTLVVLAWCVYSFVALYLKNPEKNSRALLLYPPILTIALGYALHYNPMSHAAMGLTLLTLLLLQLVALTSPGLKELFSPFMVGQFFKRIFAKPIQFLFAPFKTLKATKEIKSKSLKTLLLVLAGLAVAVPVCALLLMWFNLADAAFADGYRRFMDYLAELVSPKWGRIFLNLFLMILIGTPLGAIVLFNRYEAGAAPDGAPAPQKRGIGAIPLAAFLSAISLIMILFVITQFAYFFFGAANGAIEEIGYSEYARRGFFELSYASALVFVVAAVALALSKRNEAGKLPLFTRCALVVICFCNIVILISALQRMNLYVEAHGYSIKRLMTLWLMPLLGLCTLMLIAKCLFLKFKTLKAIGTTVVLAVCLLAVFNTDRFVARQRVDRFLETGQSQDLDIAYFKQLSYSALPELDRLVASGALNEWQASYTAPMRVSVYQTLEYERHFSDSYGWTFDRLGFSYEGLPELRDFEGLSDGSLRLGETTYVYYAAMPNPAARGEQIGVIDGKLNYKIFELEGYSSEDWIVKCYDWGTPVYHIYRAEHVTEVPEELRAQIGY